MWCSVGVLFHFSLKILVGLCAAIISFNVMFNFLVSCNVSFYGLKGSFSISKNRRLCFSEHTMLPSRNR